MATDNTNLDLRTHIVIYILKFTRGQLSLLCQVEYLECLPRLIRICRYHHNYYRSELRHAKLACFLPERWLTQSGNLAISNWQPCYDLRLEW